MILEVGLRMWLYFLSAEPDTTTGIHSVMGSKYRLYWYVPYDAISRLKPIIIVNFICSCSNLSTLASFRLWTCSIVADPLQTYRVRQQEVRQPIVRPTGSQATGCLHKIIIRLQIIHTVTVLPEFWLYTVFAQWTLDSTCYCVCRRLLLTSVILYHARRRHVIQYAELDGGCSPQMPVRRAPGCHRG